MTTPVTDKTDNLTGTDYADTFVVTKATDLSSSDTIDGKGQAYASRFGDEIAFQIDTGPVAIQDSQFTGVTHVEGLSLAGKAAYTVTLGADSENAGIVIVDASALTTDVKIDAAARSTGLEVDFTSKGLGAKDIIIGGAGADAIGINDTAAVTDAAFAGAKSVETLVAYGGGAMQLGAESEATGIVAVEDSGFADLTVDASSRSKAGITFTGGNAGDVLIASKFGDTFDGGYGNDVLKVKLSSADTIFDGGAGIDSDGGGVQSLVAGANLATFLTNSGIDFIGATSKDAGSSVTFDFSGATVAGQLDVRGGAGNDVFIAGLSTALDLDGGGGNDSFRYTTASLAQQHNVEGGDGRDEIVVLDTGTVDTSAFNNVHDVEIIRFAAAKSGTDSVDLKGTTGIDTVDASLAGVDLTVTAGYSSSALTIYASGKTNDLTGSKGDDTFIFDAKTFDANDKVDGHLGTNTLQFSTGGTVAASAFAGVSDIEFLKLSNAGNNVTIDDTLVAGGANYRQVDIPGFPSSYYFDFTVFGGKGNDTVDLSAVSQTQSGNGLAVFAGGGADKLIGSDSVATNFIFTQDGDLTSADTVKGNSDFDSVFLSAGTYTSTGALKNVSGIEWFYVLKNTAVDHATFVLNDVQIAAAANHFSEVIFLDGLDGGNLVDGSAVSANNSVSANYQDAGADTFIGGAGNDNIMFEDPLGGSGFTGLDKVSGGAGYDTLALYLGTSRVVTDADFTQVSSVEVLQVWGFKDTVTLGSTAEKAGISHLSLFDSTSTIDAHAYSSALYVMAYGSGTSHVTLGAGDDTIHLEQNNGSQLDSTDTFNGGGGDNTLEFGADSTVLTDDMLTGVSNMQALVFRDTTTSVTATLDVHAEAAGIRTIDASTSAVGMTLTAAHISAALTVTGSGYNDTIVMSDGNDRITGGLGADDLTGGAGNDTFVYTNAKDSHLTGSSAASVDTIQDFGTGTDTIDLSAFSGKLLGTLHILSTSADLATFINAAGAGFGAHHGDVAFGLIGTDTYVAADVNGDGVLNDQDVVIKLVGDHRNDLGNGGLVLS